VRSRALDCRHLYERLRHATLRRLEQRRQHLARLGQALNAFSPLATLDRGYAIVRDARSGAIVRDAQSVASGERIEARLARGVLECVVEKRRPS
jgi:exodeoxyribonuclease VII large subunit